MGLEHGYYVGKREAVARGLPDEGVYPPAELTSHPLPLSETSPVAAEVNDGRWIARCPFCSGAEAVASAYPIFWCDTCQMADLHGQAVRVAFPADIDAIEVELNRRPRRHRNYVPGEIETAYAKRDLPVDVTVAEWLHAESIVFGFVNSTVAERILAKAIVWGPAAVAAELAHLDEFGADVLERRYHQGGGWTPDLLVRGSIVLGD